MRRVLVPLLAVVLNCTDNNGPGGPPADLAGAWAFAQRLTGGGSTCKNNGSVTITQDGSSFTANYAQTGFCTGPTGSIDNSGSGQITNGRINGTHLQFGIPGCTYRGDAVGTPPDGATGSVTCQISVSGQPVNFTGTWRVSHGVASVTVTPNDVLIGTNRNLSLTATAYDASGNVLTGRQIVWGSRQPLVATVTNGTLETVDAGFATITATTLPIAPLEDSVTGIATVHVLTSALGVSAGWLHTCAVLQPNIPACWGAGFDGRLGNGTPDHPVDHPRPVSGTFTQVSGGFRHSCGTTPTHQAFCWGYELVGELGDGVSSATRLAPVAVSGGLSFDVVSAGNNFSCGITVTNGAYCWGSGTSGQLGNGAFKDDSTPVLVSGGLSFIAITTGRDVELQPVGSGFACGIAANSAAYCWGNNSHGELGDSGSSSHSAPFPVAHGLTFMRLSAGYQHVCGVTLTNLAYCWGKGTSGQLGNGAAVGSNLPVPVSGGLQFFWIAAGSDHTCGITTSGDAYCWGANQLGQLGTGVFAPDFAPPQTTPVAVIGGLRFVMLSAGAAHTCGITVLGLIYCWGRGIDGQLGSGLVNRAEPTPVLVP
jgi:alpha-tubulin suppressor-like RCC1 family protein